MTHIGPLLATALALSLTAATPAGAVTPSEPTTTAAQSFLRAHPGGALLTVDEVVYPDGSGFVAVDSGTLSLSECTTGRFCMWGSASYTGSFTYVTAAA